MVDECLICKKHYTQGGKCMDDRRNCLLFEEEPRGKMIRDTIIVQFGFDPNILVKPKEKFEVEDGRELTVISIKYIDFETREFCVEAYYHESETPADVKRSKFRVLQGGRKSN